MVRWEAGFCGGGEFWNSQKTWYTSYPSFTKCFEWTVLTYVGAALLWVAAALSVLRRERALPKQIPLTFLGFWKTGNVSILAACYLWLAVRDATQPPDKMAIAGILCSMIKCVSCLIILVLHCTRRKGIIIPRTTLWTYWLIETVMSSPRVYRVLVAAPSLMAEEELTESRTLIMATYSLTMISFILECFTDSGSLEQDKGTSNPSPLLSASPLSAIFFEWMTSFIFKGYKRDITEEDLFDPPSYLKTQANFETWEVLWNRELKRAKFNPVNGSFDWKRAPSLFRTLRVMFWPNFLLLLVMIFVRSLVRVSVALVLHLMMNFMGDNSQPVWQGVFCSLTLFSLTLIASRALRYSEYLMAIVGIRIRGILMTAIYQKALRISSNSRGRYTIGEIVNLASIDADKVFRLCTATTMVVVAPLTILLSTTLIWHYLGASCLAGIAVILLIIPISGFLASKNRRMHEKLMALKDCRLEAMHEIINSIKILKLFAWEPPFMARVESVRDKEASLLNVFVYMLATTEFIYTCTPFLVGLMSFMTFVLVSPDNVLTPAVAFVTLTLFNQIRLSMVVIPDFISSCAQTIVALRRIREFLMSEEKDPGLIGRSPSGGNVITMQNVTVSWDDGGLAPVLSRVSLSARRGKLLAIVGPLGSGKSSLLSSILGDMTLTEGRIDVAGSIAYAAQTAWIQNQTIRDNIIFTSKFDRRKYERVLDACCLRADLSVLPEGDATEIGEKGINLSGGQKQRVALARAVYQDKEIYLFDDPLSALDAHVGKSVFKSVIGPEGMLREKTRLLVTNDPSVMQNADYIVILKDGRISEEGTYADLINSRGSLANLLKILGIEESASDSPDAKTRDGNRSRSQDDETALIESIVEGAAQSRTKKNVLVEKEKVETGAVKWDVYKNFLKHMGFTLPLLGILSHLASQALDVVVGLWLSAWTEDRDLSIWNRNRRLSIYAVLGISQAVMNFCGVALLTKAIINAATKLHRVILGSLMRAPLTFFDLTPSGRILNRFGRDLNQLDTELPVTVKFMLEMVLRIIGVVGLISIKIPSFLVAAFAFIVLFVVLRRISVRTLRQVKRLESVTRSPVYSHFSETIQGLSSIRGFGVGRVFEKIHEAKLDVAQNCSFHGTTTHHWLYSRLELLGNIMILIMFILCVINREHFDAGTAGLLISYSLSSMYAFNFVIHYSSELEATIVAAERLDEYARVTPEAEWTSKDPPEDDWPSAGAITFENYSARYRAGLELILRGVNLTVASRQKIGVVGRTGAGKSSLISTLFRIIEAETGRIVIDRRDISKIGLHELRSRLTIIPQEPVLFDATLRFNLDPTNEYTDETLWRALESTHLGRFFKNLMGLDTPIAECGSNLSAGQRQLVCLARAVLRKRRILVLDEATASVDLETDVLIQETIRSAFGDSTIITIAHRINTILDSDVVVVMSRGNIAEIGPPEDLLKDARSEFAVMAREAGISVNHKSTTD